MGTLYCLISIFFLTLFVGLGASVNVYYIPDTCIPLLRDRCSNLTRTVLCYDGQVFDDWCSFANAGCDGKLRPNVTTVHLPVNASCVVIFLIRNHVATHRPHTTTPVTLTAFEEHFYNAAIHGIDDLLIKANASGATIDVQKKIFSVQDHNQKRYLRSDKCWAYSLDLTPISPWNSMGHTRKAGTLISPRHALWARHYSMKVNTTLRFVDKNNNVVDRCIVKTSLIPTHGHPYLRGYDIVVGELDRDVPSTISFAKVLPRNLTTIRPGRVHIPVFDTDFEEKALVANLNYESSNMIWLGTPSHSSIRYPFFETKIKGDSGNPVFLVVDSELVLLFVFTYGGSGGGTSITYHYDAVNDIMKRWGTGYQLTEVDLTKYLDTGNQIPNIIG
ncbi:uncharacterized protein LOC123529480 [Mercenaria mercenaria]|uniref:uncharacterized protein LOC123529480 n=1 Tax=Mercenaria mercenaria TaxID=6596 RepID=UPI00234E78C8|nr:uncharacterized protein LOC123529480 [Mercenaria mercenaria]